ncbi:MAG: DUF1614 domain-containing protein, partial [Acidobacteria bacterium]
GEVVVAANVGGAVVPVVLAVWEVLQLLHYGAGYFLAALLATAVTATVCYLMARPLPGLGIVLPLIVPAARTGTRGRHGHGSAGHRVRTRGDDAAVERDEPAGRRLQRPDRR